MCSQQKQNPLLHSSKAKAGGSSSTAPSIIFPLTHLNLPNSHRKHRYVKLIDSPGIVFGDKTHSASDLVLRNCVRLEDLEDPVPAVHGVLTRCDPEAIMEMYTVPA